MRLGILAFLVSMVAACGFNGPAGEGVDASPDVDAAPGQVTVAFATPDSVTDETAQSHTVSVALSAAATGPVTVNYKVVGGTATPNLDFQLADGVLTFAPGTTQQTITMVILQDSIDEPDEVFTIALDGPDGAALGQPSQHHVTISANTVPRVAFANNGAVTLSEVVTSPGLSVALDRVSTVPITVSYKVVPASTTATGGGVDYTLADGMLVISAGQQSGVIPLAVVNDLLDEDDEVVAIQLSSPINAELGAASLEMYTIADDDLPPTVAFATATTSFSENAGATTVSVALSAPSGKTIMVPYTVTLGTASVADVSVSNGTLTFAPGDTTKTIPIAIIQDTLDEDDETFTLALGTPVNATPGAILSDLVTIVDDDAAPTVSITTASSSVLESVGTVNLNVVLSAASSKPITVTFAATGTAVETGDYNYSPATHTLTFTPGALSQTIGIAVVQDSIDEVDETAITTLTAATNATITGSAQTLTIIDDDPTCLGPTGPFQVCLVDMPSTAVVLGTTLNTDGVACMATLPIGWMMSQPDTCFIVGTTITQSGMTKVIGSRPLALVASDTITISGTLDVSSHQTGSNGPGSGTACLSTGTGTQPQNGGNNEGGGGGAGGSFMSRGGNGGIGSVVLTAGGTSALADGSAPTALRAGCAGQRGGNSNANATIGVVGKGGGGLYILAGVKLVIDNSIIDASGAGGSGGDGSAGGSGGGSGGMIKLFSATITAVNAKLFANGGGGASGADNNNNGAPGSDPTTVTTPAAGGPTNGNGGTGGTGFAGATQATPGSFGGAKGGGGAGGGGGGFLQSNQALTGATFSAGQLDIAP